MKIWRSKKTYKALFPLLRMTFEKIYSSWKICWFKTFIQNIKQKVSSSSVIFFYTIYDQKTWGSNKNVQSVLRIIEINYRWKGISYFIFPTYYFYFFLATLRLNQQNARKFIVKDFLFFFFFGMLTYVTFFVLSFYYGLRPIINGGWSILRDERMLKFYHRNGVIIFF